MQYFIDVILPIPLERLFTYRITKAEFDFIQPGMRVAVPFGKSKIYTGLVYELHHNAPEIYEAKDIEQILDEAPVINPKQLELWEWIAQYYMCTLGDVLRAALPGGLLLESETIISKNEIKIDEGELLNDDEFLVYEALHHQSELKVKDLVAILGKKHILPVLKSLLEKKAINLKEEIYERYKPKLVRYVRLGKEYDSDDSLNSLLDRLSKAPKQKQVIMTLFSLKAQKNKPIKVSELISRSNASSGQIRTLIDKGILEDYFIKTDRIAYTGTVRQEVKSLSEFQQAAYKTIKNDFKDHNVSLLHGVTSSGKTEIYVKLIEEILEEGRQVLYLVPEIALTSQLVHRLQRYFGKSVVVYHSRYSLNERIEIWNAILKPSDNPQVVLGARSSIFLPFDNLGLIIVDEEHEQSFKQFDPAPRYHARDSAIVLAGYFNAKVLLGSATPSLESYYNATIVNKYGFVNLKRRYNDVLMPEIELVDLKDKRRRKRMTGHFSDRLLEEMHLALQEGQQVILFQNRRGFSPIIECHTCGHSPQCPNCDVSLTYHQYKDQLRCHYCGHAIGMLSECQACRGVELDSIGFGTEQVEEEARQLFPEAKVGRMDLDSTRGKHGYEKIINAFEEQEIDILVGTQMLTKGLDFRNVNVVGIMNADNMLNFPDFRAHERSFQLMQQVSGRAGRTAKRGKVLIQSYNPYHKILQQVSNNDFESMFKEQLEQRRHYKYPPFYRLIKITLKHKDLNKVNTGADWLGKYLKQMFGDNMLGPEFPPIARIRNQFHKNILIKIPQDQPLRKTKKAILKVKNSFLSIKDFRSIRLILNVDNY
jgi:primosomal protein N' (replication factor Y)